jgi:hypothetical protein
MRHLVVGHEQDLAWGEGDGVAQGEQGRHLVGDGTAVLVLVAREGVFTEARVVVAMVARVVVAPLVAGVVA